MAVGAPSAAIPLLNRGAPRPRETLRAQLAREPRPKSSLFYPASLGIPRGVFLETSNGHRGPLPGQHMVDTCSASPVHFRGPRGTALPPRL